MFSTPVNAFRGSVVPRLLSFSYTLTVDNVETLTVWRRFSLTKSGASFERANFA